MSRRRNDTSLRKPVAPVSPGSSERENPSPGVGDDASDAEYAWSEVIRREAIPDMSAVLVAFALR
jgi:hypothetical protein